MSLQASGACHIPGTVHERKKATHIEMKTATLHHRAALTAALAAAGLVAALLLSISWLGAAAHADVRTQSGACPGATAGAAAENQQAFVDLGAGASGTFVCISASAFAGGVSAPISANGTYGDGCYIVEGLGTSVVAVYRESPSVKQCPDLVRVDVGTGTAPTPTSTATSTPTSTATATPSATQPGTPSATATASPKPPTAGTGFRDEEGLGFHAYAVGITFLAIAVLAAGGVFAFSRKRR